MEEWSVRSEGSSGWARGYQEGQLDIDASGNAFFIGTFQYDFPAGDIELFSRHEAGVVVKVDENGEVLWASSLEAEGGRVTVNAGTLGEGEGRGVRVEGLAVAEEDKLIIGGEFISIAALDEENIFENFGYNLFLASTGALATDVKYLAPEYFSLAVSPNPFRSNFQLSMKLGEAQSVRFALFDLQGRMVEAFVPVDFPGNGKHAINLSPSESLPPGMYFLRVEAGGVVTVKKVEKM